MFTNLFGTRTPRCPERGRFFRPKLEPLEDRLSPSSLQGGPAATGAPFDQLAGTFLNSYNQAAQLNAPQTNALVLNAFMLAESTYFSTVVPLPGSNSDAFQTFMGSVQDAINQNPMEQTPVGQLTGTLAFALMTNALLSGQTSV